MLTAGVLCLCAAAACAFLGARALARPAAEGNARVLRAVAPTQLAAAVVLAAGGLVALSDRPSIALVALCVAGAVCTVAAGVWQGARFALRQRQPMPCRSVGRPCETCTLSCRA